jgi:hypothetical protein
MVVAVESVHVADDVERRDADDNEDRAAHV